MSHPHTLDAYGASIAPSALDLALPV